MIIRNKRLIPGAVPWEGRLGASFSLCASVASVGVTYESCLTYLSNLGTSCSTPGACAVGILLTCVPVLLVFSLIGFGIAQATCFAVSTVRCFTVTAVACWFLSLVLIGCVR